MASIILSIGHGGLVALVSLSAITINILSISVFVRPSTLYYLHGNARVILIYESNILKNRMSLIFYSK